MKEHAELKIDGLTLRGYLEYPQGNKFPLLLMFHGFTGDCTESNFMFSRISRHLVKEGIGTLRFSFPGSGESDGEFKNTSTLIWSGYIRKISEYARTIEGVDREKIYSLGMSLGGASLIRSMADHDLKILLAPAIGYADKYKDTVYKGNLEVGPCLYEDEENAGYELILSKMKERVVFIHAKDDKTVAYSVSERYSKIPSDSKLYTIDSGGHTFDEKMGFERLLEIITDEIKNRMKEPHQK